MAPGVGIEPTIAESKSVVLPLHYPGIKLVACTRIELVSVDYQSTALAIELTGCKFVLGRCSSDDRLDIISRPLFGGKGEIRTHTGHRMKVLHYHYATLPYVNTLHEHELTCLH